MSSYSFIIFSLFLIVLRSPTNVASSDIVSDLSFPVDFWSQLNQTNLTLPITSQPVTLEGNETDTLIVRFVTPLPLRNRWQLIFSYTNNKTSTASITTLHSCAFPSTCATRWPSLIGTMPVMYDTVTYQGTRGQWSDAISPRFPNMNTGFTSSNSGMYPNCMCTNTHSLANFSTSDDQWHIRTSKLTQNSTRLNVSVSLVDMCSGHGRELPVTNTQLGCECDRGYFGRQCADSSQTQQAQANGRLVPCCSNYMHDLSAAPNVPIAVSNSSWDKTPLRSAKIEDNFFTYRVDDQPLPFNKSSGIIYNFRIRNLQPGNPRCQSTFQNVWAPTWFMVGMCNMDPVAVGQCLDNIHSLTPTNLQWALYTDYSNRGQGTHFSQWNNGDWYSFSMPPSQSRTKCGCTNSPLTVEEMLAIKIVLPHSECSMEFSANATAYCLNNGTFYRLSATSGCSCPSGFAGPRCEIVCQAGMGGPDCATRLYALENGVEHTFLSVRSNQTYFSFTSPPPTGNPRVLRVTVKGDSANPDLLVRIAGKERCDETSCPITSRQGLVYNSYGFEQTTPFPMDFGTLAYETPRAYATFISRQYVSERGVDLITGVAALLPNPDSQYTLYPSRQSCGCLNRNTSSELYEEKWYFVLTHSSSLLPTANITLRVDSFDVCNGHGRWDSASKLCRCEIGYTRGPDGCGIGDSYLTPCCVPCQTSTVSGSFNQSVFNCTDAVTEVVSTPENTDMPVTRADMPQIPGVLPPVSTIVFNNERAIFRVSSIPRNPNRGNPWLMSWRLTASLTTVGWPIYHAGGVHTCSLQPNCTNLLPKALKTFPYSYWSEWSTDPMQRIIQPPIDIGGYITPAKVDARVTPLLMPFNPVSYYTRYEYPYIGVMNGSSTMMPQECMCQPSQNDTTLDPLMVTGDTFLASNESWNFVTSYLSQLGLGANRLTLIGNFSDVCAGHGKFDYSTGRCQCDDDGSNVYFGSGCVGVTPPGPSRASVYLPFTNPLQPSQCCTGRLARAPHPVIYSLNQAHLARAPGVDTNVTVEVKYDNTYAQSAQLDGKYTGVGVWDIDQTDVVSGQNYFVRLSVANGSVGACSPTDLWGRLNVRVHRVCGNYTINQCLEEVTANLQQDAYLSGFGLSYWGMTVIYRQGCGCREPFALEKHLIVRFVSPVNTCKMYVEPYLATVQSCPKATGTWSNTILGTGGKCICHEGWYGSACQYPLNATRGEFTLSGYDPINGGAIKSASAIQNDATSYNYWTAILDPSDLPSNNLNLNISMKCPKRRNTASNTINVDVARCYDEPLKRAKNNGTYESLKTNVPWYFTPEETLAWVRRTTNFVNSFSPSMLDFAQLARLHMGVPNYLVDIPLQHCDHATFAMSENNNVYGISIGAEHGQMTVFPNWGTTATIARNSALLFRPGPYSPCRTYTTVPGTTSSSATTRVAQFADPSCLTTKPYYVVRLRPSTGISFNYPGPPDGCVAQLSQTPQPACDSGTNFLPCGIGSANGCQVEHETGSNRTVPTCGACVSGYEGAGCHMPIPSYSELVNGDNQRFESRMGSRIRFSVQVSPTNDPVKLTFSMTQMTNCTTCTTTAGRVWIRARLGSPPPNLRTKVIVDHAKKTVRIDSDGSDEEYEYKPPAPRNSSSSSSSTGSASGSTGLSGSSSGVFSSTGSSLRRLLQFGFGGDDKEVSKLTGEVYRYDVATTDEAIELRFPDPSHNFKITDHEFLYVDIYQGNTIEMTGSQSSTIDPNSNAYVTFVDVKVAINDPLGEILGQIVLIVLGSFAFLSLAYLIYLRCRYGSVVGGVEQSILTKAKVQRGSVVPKSPSDVEREQRKREKERARRMAKVEADAEELEKQNNNKFKTLLKVFFALLAFVLILVFEILKVLFNISILHTSVGSFIPVVEFGVVSDAVSDGLRSIGLEKFKAIWAELTVLFEYLGVFNKVSLRWNCGGTLSMFAPVVILLGSIVLIVILQKDYFLRFALSMKGSAVGTHVAIRKARKAIAIVLSTFLLYILQASILVLTQVVASTWNVTRSCSEFDQKLVIIGRWLSIAFIVILFYVSGLVFAGIKQVNSYTLTNGWVSGVWALLQLTFGLWTRSTVDRFDIHTRARDFDIDDNHDENPEEAVMELQGASRGLMWTAFPIGIVFTKLTEQINSPPFLIAGNYIGVDITTPRWNRGLKWFVGMLKLGSILYTVWSANQLVVILTFILTAVSVSLNVFLPSDYHRKKWMNANSNRIEPHPIELDNLSKHDQSTIQVGPGEIHTFDNYQ